MIVFIINYAADYFLCQSSDYFVKILKYISEINAIMTAQSHKFTMFLSTEKQSNQ